MKIGRAYKNVLEFDSLVGAHCRRTDLFTATSREDVKSGRLIVRVEFAKLEGDILLSPGDFVYNLRSGLDQLAWQLCLSGGGDPGRDTMFPIYESDGAKSEAMFLKRVKNMPADACQGRRKKIPVWRRKVSHWAFAIWLGFVFRFLSCGPLKLDVAAGFARFTLVEPIAFPVHLENMNMVS